MENDHDPLPSMWNHVRMKPLPFPVGNDEGLANLVNVSPERL